MELKMKTRNPIAGNAWKYNKAKVVPPKKGKGSSHQRVSPAKLKHKLPVDQVVD